MDKPRIGLLFNYDWDALGFARLAAAVQLRRRRLRPVLLSQQRPPGRLRPAALCRPPGAPWPARGWAGVVSHHEQFGALAAALVAEAAGLPGTPVNAILACQHKLHARQVLQQVCPEANLPFAALDACYGGPVPDGLHYPAYVKPVKAAFSVLARRVDSQAELHAHTRFGRRELWVIRRLVEPFERVVRERLPQAGTAHRLMLEAPVQAAQFNLDGWVYRGQAHALGVVDAVMYPGTQAFMRWEHPSRLPGTVQARALDVAQRFLTAVGFDHGMFNIEFFHDPATDRLTVIEVNPRLASAVLRPVPPCARAGPARHVAGAGAGARPGRPAAQRAGGRCGGQPGLPRHAARCVAAHARPGTARGAGAALSRGAAVHVPQDRPCAGARLQMAGQPPLRHPAPAWR